MFSYIFLTLCASAEPKTGFAIHQAPRLVQCWLWICLYSPETTSEWQVVWDTGWQCHWGQCSTVTLHATELQHRPLCDLKSFQVFPRKSYLKKTDMLGAPELCGHILRACSYLLLVLRPGPKAYM